MTPTVTTKIDIDRSDLSIFRMLKILSNPRVSLFSLLIKKSINKDKEITPEISINNINAVAKIKNNKNLGFILISILIKLIITVIITYIHTL